MRFATLSVRAIGVFAALLSCARSEPPPVARVTPGEDRAEERPAATPRGLGPLTQRETELVGELERHVHELAVGIGERHPAKSWNLAEATDYVAGVLERQGHAVQRLGFAAGDAVVQNVQATVAAEPASLETVVVGAHYDTHPGTPGADDNASGSAAVLALARRFVGVNPRRNLRFVLFVNEEQPYFQTEQMGSLVYAKSLVVQEVDVVAMFSLESLGYFDEAPNSQRYPAEVAGRYPQVANFIAVIGNPESKDLLERVSTALRRSASIPVVSDVLPADVPGVAWSDHWAFWKVGYPAVMVTDTAPFRNPHYHQSTDLPEHLDFGRMARVVAGLEAVVRDLVEQ